MNFSALMPWLLRCLNVTQGSDLSPYNQAELFNYAAEALHDIGGRFLLVAEYHAFGTTMDVHTYQLSPLHIQTIYATSNSEMLKPTTVAEMEALDTNWKYAASGTPQRWIGNILGLDQIRLYPPPDAAGLFEDFVQEHPPDLSPASDSVFAPAPIGDYLLIRTQQHARLRQGEMQMPDVAGALDSLAQIYEGCLARYYGKGALSGGV